MDGTRTSVVRVALLELFTLADRNVVGSIDIAECMQEGLQIPTGCVVISSFRSMDLWDKCGQMTVKESIWSTDDLPVFRSRNRRWTRQI